MQAAFSQAPKLKWAGKKRCVLEEAGRKGIPTRKRGKVQARFMNEEMEVQRKEGRVHCRAA